MNTQNNWFDGDHPQIDFYLSSQDDIIVERKRCITILLSIFSYHFTDKKQLGILDLGCGDGIISDIINKGFPGHSFTLIDGSPKMLEKARTRLTGDSFTFREITFERLLEEPIEPNRFDFIFSSMAIHHCMPHQKEQLYSRIFHELAFGGLFLNIDVVHPRSERSEIWQFNLWREWLREQAEEKNGAGADFPSGLPETYKYKAENKPGRLSDQLTILERTGFRDVDCFFKHGIFALFGGTR
jgi:tRNA (cmo5U34)-methyltransferase